MLLPSHIKFVNTLVGYGSVPTRHAYRITHAMCANVRIRDGMPNEP